MDIDDMGDDAKMQVIHNKDEKKKEVIVMDLILMTWMMTTLLPNLQNKKKKKRSQVTIKTSLENIESMIFQSPMIFTLKPHVYGSLDITKKVNHFLKLKSFKT